MRETCLPNPIRGIVSLLKAFLLGLVVKRPGPVWTVGIPFFSRQLDDRRPLLRAIGKGLYEEAFVAILDNLNFNRLFRHSYKTPSIRNRFPCQVPHSGTLLYVRRFYCRSSKDDDHVKIGRVFWPP